MNNEISQNIVKNPYKSEASIMDKYCILKSAVVAGGGYVMGIGLAFFMNAMEEIDTSRGARIATREALLIDLKKIKSTAKSFAVFGGLFALFECMVEKQRMRHDSINSFFGGGLTTMYLAMDSGMKWRGLMMTGFTGGMFGVVMEKLFEGFH